jgi:hypothetical protein
VLSSLQINGIVLTSWVDCPYKASTCDVMLVDSSAVYIMVAKFSNTICPPRPQFLLRCLLI